MNNDEWQNAALKFGEKLSSTGPEGYYSFTAVQWLKWAEDSLVDKENLKRSIEKLVLLHKLFLQNKGDSILADKIRDELDEHAKHIPEENEWMVKLSSSLYDLVEKALNSKV